MTEKPKSWRVAFAVYLKPRVLSMTALGFSAGLPYLLIFSTLSAWLRDEGVERSVIGFFSWVSATYSIKILWSPIVDKVHLPILGRLLGQRRSWMLFAQLGIIAGLCGMASANSQTQLSLIAACAIFVAFCSATQDVSIDAFRIESSVSDYQGAMAAMYVLGYRLALLVAGAGSFYIAEFFDWHIAYFAMAAAMSFGVITTLCLKSTVINPNLSAIEKKKVGILVKINDAIIHPFTDFFARQGRLGWLILLLIALYKMSDLTMGVMANPFYLDLGFNKKEIAEISKIFGFFMTIAGAALGGVFVAKYGVMRPLLIGAMATASTNLLFAVLASVKPDLMLLAGVISADNLSGGFATSVFIAYLSGLARSDYTATQYALFSSLMTFPAQFLGGFSGIIVDKFGYINFFIYASSIGLPAILLTLWLWRREVNTKKQNFL
ncbi:MAG: MFS transporter [Methylococcales bacterium]|nr:MFS transporter [Methylococcales bacterium]